MNPYLASAHKLQEGLAKLAATLHRQPELSFEEKRTTARINKVMALPELEQLDLGLPTGAAWLLRGGAKGKGGGLVVLRADIDAIAQTEAPGHALRSETDGVMHGCGHDIHTGCLVGAARLLCAQKAQLKGDVLFLFQPGEEVTRGAAAVLAGGLWDKLPTRPNALLGLHCAPQLPVGTMGVNPAEVMAGKTNFIIELTGVAGHAGLPHQCVDVVTAGAAVVQAVQTIVSRNTDPLKPLVCAIHTVHAGEEDFFVPGTLRMTGSIRAFDAEVMKAAEGRLVQLAGLTAQAYQCGCEVKLIPEVPPLVNSPALVPVARQAAQKVAEAVTSLPPTLLSDDFSVLAAQMPGVYFWLGSAADPATAFPLHHPDFVADPGALAYGSALLAQAAVLVLEADDLGEKNASG